MNILFVMTDQQHFRTLGCTGASDARTPNIDALARGGTLFRNHFVANPVCSPSRGAIMTGRYPTQNGLWCNGCRLSETHDTIPKAMARRGYQTAHFGKLHLVPIVNRTAPHPSYGFETCEVAEGDQQLIDDAYFRWLRTEHPDAFVALLKEMYAKGHASAYTSELPESLHLSTWVTRRSTDWLRNRRNHSRPFFLSVGFFDPHHAWNPVEPYASGFADAEVLPPVYREGSIDLKPLHYRAHFDQCSPITRDPDRITAIRRANAAMCAHIDHCVGELIAALQELGLANDTWVVFTSDHGELLGNHGLLWKGPYLLDDLLRVPLVVGIPGSPREGRVVNDLTSSVDFFPTFQMLAGCEAPAPSSGRAFFGTDGELFPEGPREHVLVEWEHPRASEHDSIRCIRTRDAKLVHYNHGDAGELYDLRSDPCEFENLYASERHRSLRQSLEQRLFDHYLSYRPTTRFEGGW
jgi:arylsulfatase